MEEVGDSRGRGQEKSISTRRRRKITLR